MVTKITVFGEVLWDVLPSSKLAGGAPMNVAAHLNRYGLDVAFVSRVGSDDLGRDLIGYMENNGLSTRWVQIGQTHLTGVAKANISDNHEVTYKILHPVAWDYIQFDKHALAAVSGSDFFIYGTLASRDEMTRSTLLQYLAQARLKIFDVNLRPPHYTSDGVIELLKYADVVKMNESEVKEICSWFATYQDIPHAMEFIKERFDLKSVIVTCGGDGAMVLTEHGQLFRHPGFEVEVEDTIGSGDAFLAAFLYRINQGEQVNSALEFACGAGAIVASKAGALPAFSEEDIALMISSRNINVLK
ncbi:carbohydrate kinase [Emticicia sp. CRIBPO]|uniref:carbohydrate kinase family protein n=1 Tax=Emticicia sp. CRIBPO TaxID=2683258 RepID=UPI001411BE81|nr:carbohydrate kinase [Emticicia sp. CRIBPO]NBA86551.1 carbohydrate kinase [Emticicia sp. CRIBPO]